LLKHGGRSEFERETRKSRWNSPMNAPAREKE
jgi:hypothetical protein